MSAIEDAQHDDIAQDVAVRNASWRRVLPLVVLPIVALTLAVLIPEHLDRVLVAAVILGEDHGTVHAPLPSVAVRS